MSDYHIHVILTKEHNVDERVLRRDDMDFNTWDEAIYAYELLVKP